MFSIMRKMQNLAMQPLVSVVLETVEKKRFTNCSVKTIGVSFWLRV